MNKDVNRALLFDRQHVKRNQTAYHTTFKENVIDLMSCVNMTSFFDFLTKYLNIVQDVSRFLLFCSSKKNICFMLQ
jgi:hypothetical protein